MPAAVLVPAFFLLTVAVIGSLVAAPQLRNIVPAAAALLDAETNAEAYSNAALLLKLEGATVLVAALSGAASAGLFLGKKWGWSVAVALIVTGVVIPLSFAPHYQRQAIGLALGVSLSGLAIFSKTARSHCGFSRLESRHVLTTAGLAVFMSILLSWVTWANLAYEAN